MPILHYLEKLQHKKMYIIFLRYVSIEKDSESCKNFSKTDFLKYCSKIEHSYKDSNTLMTLNNDIKKVYIIYNI